MPNHAHALLTPLEGFELEEILQSIKSFTAKKLNERIHSTGTLWQDESFDHIVRDGQPLKRVQEYNRENPTKENLDPKSSIVSEESYGVKRVVRVPRRSA